MLQKPSISNESLSGLDQHPDRSGVAVYTCVLGGVEKTLKEPIDCQGADFFAFTDRSAPVRMATLRNMPVEFRHEARTANEWSCWQTKSIGQHLETLHDPRYRGMRNSLENNLVLANVAKWYKINPHVIRELLPYKFAIWVDGTVIMRLSVASLVFQQVLSNTSMITAFHHCEPRPLSKYERCRHGNPEAELVMGAVSVRDFRKIGGMRDTDNISLFDANEAAIAPMRQWYFNQSGWTRRWFQNDSDFLRHAPTQFHQREYGVWWCGMLFYNLINPDTRRYVETWWEEHANQSFADQTPFAFAGWRTRLLVHSLPQHGVLGSWLKSNLHKKSAHGN